MNSVKKRVYKDCSVAMRSTLLLNILREGLEVFVFTLVLGYLGKYANNIIEQNLVITKTTAIKLVVSLLFLIIIVPVLDFIKRLEMLKGALKHDRLLYMQYLKMKYCVVREMDAGELQYRLEREPIDLRFLWVEIQTRCIVVVFTIIFLITQVKNFDVLFFVCACIISLLRAIIPFFVQKLEQKYDYETRKFEEKNEALEVEYISNIVPIKENGLGSLYIKKIKALFAEFFHKTKSKFIFCNVIVGETDSFLQKITYILILSLGCLFIQKDMVSIGVVVAMLGYSEVISMIVNDLDFVIRKRPILENRCDRLTLFYENEESIGNTKTLPEKYIRFSNLSFKYDDQFGFENLNGTLMIHQKNVILGDNGSGKTTLVKIICGLETEYEGSIELDETNFREVDRIFWRDKIGIAFQMPTIFEGTIRDNIIMFCKDYDQEYLDSLISILGLKDIENRMLCDDDKSVSGGELQKISLGRALLKKPYILFLDEPDNHLDVDTSEWLKKFIEQYKGTLIYIAHTKELIDLADNRICL